MSSTVCINTDEIPCPRQSGATMSRSTLGIPRRCVRKLTAPTIRLPWIAAHEVEDAMRWVKSSNVSSNAGTDGVSYRRASSTKAARCSVKTSPRSLGSTARMLRPTCYRVTEQRARTAADRSPAVTTDSPTSTASKPARYSTDASSGPRTPDSATRTSPAGICGAMRTARSWSTSKVTRSRWFTPMT